MDIDNEEDDEDVLSVFSLIHEDKDDEDDLTEEQAETHQRQYKKLRTVNFKIVSYAIFNLQIAYRNLHNGTTENTSTSWQQRIPQVPTAPVLSLP